MHTGKQKQMNASYQASLVNRHIRRFTGVDLPCLTWDCIITNRINVHFSDFHSAFVGAYLTLTGTGAELMQLRLMQLGYSENNSRTDRPILTKLGSWYTYHLNNFTPLKIFNPVPTTVIYALTRAQLGGGGVRFFRDS